MSEPSAQGHERRPVRRALVSVYEKEGLPELAAGLHKLGVDIVSTGSTAQRIAETGVPVTAVEDLTGFPECLDGRVKTLHPKVHAGLLADTRRPEHLAQLDELGVAPFDLLVANLYPFAETVASGATPDECVEQIDIGGPAMVRASAKNHDSVAVVVDPERYEWLIEQIEAGGFTLDDRRRLAAAAFRHTATYDVAVASWLGSVLAPDGDGPFPVWVGATWERASTLRYGENPHQAAALYTAGRGGLAGAEQLHGKEMSYNNYVDADAAWRAAHDHGDVPTVAVIKHTNPCGIAVGADVAEAHRKAHATDPVSAFGGVIAANGEVSAAMAEQVAEVFTEVVLAPSYAPAALEILTRKKNVRAAPAARGGCAGWSNPSYLSKTHHHAEPDEPYSRLRRRIVGIKSPTPEEMISLHDSLARYMPDRVRPAGELTAYSNYGAALAGYIVEAVSGMPFEQYVETYIFTPLSMVHSSFRQPLPQDFEGQLATSYSYNGEFVPGSFTFVNLRPAGAMSSTAHDMANFMVAHLQDGRSDNNQILKAGDGTPDAQPPVFK